MLRVRCTCIGHRIAHTCIPAAETIIRSTLPFRVRKSLHSREHFCFVVFLTCDRGWPFILCLINFFFPLLLSLFILSNRLFIVENGFYDGIADFCFWNVAQVRAPGHPPCQERRRCSHYFIFFSPLSFFFNLLPLPRSCLLVSSQHCSVPLNVLTIKPGERVLYLCSVFAEYENVSMQYQSDELRRVDQRQRKYLGVFSISPC